MLFFKMAVFLKQRQGYFQKQQETFKNNMLFLKIASYFQKL